MHVKWPGDIRHIQHYLDRDEPPRWAEHIFSRTSPPFGEDPVAMGKLSFEDIAVDQFVECKRSITEEAIFTYIELTGDYNPVLIDDEYSSTTIFPQMLAPPLLVASLVAATLSTELPGPGAIYLRQNFTFTAPVRIGDEITARVEVIAKDERKKTLILRTICLNQRDSVVINGEAVGLVSWR